MDTVGDFITVIRNATTARKEKCTVQWSKMREGILDILKQEGFIAGYNTQVTKCGLKSLNIFLKYVEGMPGINSIRRHSKPGRRFYYQYTKLPRVLDGLGMSILSTSKGILSDKSAQRNKVGGELLFQVW